MVDANEPELNSKPPVASVRVPVTVKVAAAPVVATLRELKVALFAEVAEAATLMLSVSTPAENAVAVPVATPA